MYRLSKTATPAILIRQSCREGGEVKKRTLANTAKLPPETVEKIRAVLSGAVLAAVLAALRACGIDQAITSRRSGSRDLAVALVAHHVEMHMRKAPAPMLFDDEDGSVQGTPVTKAERSPKARRKAATKRTRSGQTVHDFRGLPGHLETLAMNRIEPSGPGKRAFDLPSSPTPVQNQALRLLNAKIFRR